MINYYKKTLKELSTEEIVQMINDESSNYTIEFLQCANVELHDRGVFKDTNDSQMQNLSKKIDDRLSEMKQHYTKPLSGYPTLRVISIIFKSIAWLALLIGAAIIILYIKDNGPKPVNLIHFIGTVMTFVINYAISELILLFMDIADNSNRIKELLQKNK